MDHLVTEAFQGRMRGYLLKELAYSRGIVSGGDEVVTRFRVFGDRHAYHVFVHMPDSARRRELMPLVKLFMAVKMVRTFIMSSELHKPDSIMAVAVSHSGMEGLLQLIKRKPLSFGDHIAVPQGQVGDEVFSLLPDKSASITHKELDDLHRALAIRDLQAFELNV